MLHGIRFTAAMHTPVFRCAESALHSSMRTLDHAITYYHNEMRYRARHRFDMEAELRGAIENQQLEVYYQPQQSTESGDLAGVEALARWIRPDGSIVPPSDFVPLSEEMGISDLLFETVMRLRLQRRCRLAAGLRVVRACQREHLGAPA